MKKILHILSVAMALLMMISCGAAETTEAVVATVNGEPLLYSDYAAIESTYLYQYEAAGLDLLDETVYTYVQDLALTYAIEQMLVVQDMKAQGFYELDAETEAWCVEQGTAAYEAAMADVGEMMRETLGLVETDDVTEYAQSYADALNVTADTYIEEYRIQYAMAEYQEWLVRDNLVTDEQVQAAYDAYVADSTARFAQDVPAFETALYSGETVWYMPEGYRMIQAVALQAEGDTDEAKLGSVQEKLDEIAALLEGGESAGNLIAMYSAATDDVYQMHPESIVFEDAMLTAAFSAEMAEPGCWSKPFVMGDLVVMMYYQADAKAGAIEMTEEIHDALGYSLYAERTREAQRVRIDELAAAAEVVFH